MKNIAATMALMSYVVVAHAGVYVETVSRNKTTGKEEATYTMQVQDGKARMEGGGSRSSVSIFKDDTLFVFDTQRKTYMAMDRATMEQTANTMNDAMTKMREQMAKLPPDQRAMMENMMKQRGMPGAAATAPAAQNKIDATPTGATEKISGRNCKIWNITRDGKLTSQVCVVAFAGLPGKDEFQALAKKMSALFDKLPEAFRSQASGNPFQQDASIGTKMNGMPFITRSYRDGVLDPQETIVKTWKEQSIPATQFDIPAGFVKQELPLGRIGNKN